MGNHFKHDLNGHVKIYIYIYIAMNTYGTCTL